MKVEFRPYRSQSAWIGSFSSSCFIFKLSGISRSRKELWSLCKIRQSIHKSELWISIWKRIQRRNEAIPRVPCLPAPLFSYSYLSRLRLSLLETLGPLDHFLWTSQGLLKLLPWQRGSFFDLVWRRIMLLHTLCWASKLCPHIAGPESPNTRGTLKEARVGNK